MAPELPKYLKLVSAIFHYFFKKNTLAFFFPHRFMNIQSRLSYHALLVFLKLLVLKKKKCMCNRNNPHKVDIFPDEKITKKSKPTNQAQTKHKPR